jgi:hypothetical protein
VVSARAAARFRRVAGQGAEPAVALAPDGRTVAVWQGVSGLTSTGVRARVLAPGGTWSAPVTATPAGINPEVAVDAAGAAVGQPRSPWVPPRHTDNWACT